jgi:hypothetical protein
VEEEVGGLGFGVGVLGIVGVSLSLMQVSDVVRWALFRS